VQGPSGLDEEEKENKREGEKRFLSKVGAPLLVAFLKRVRTKRVGKQCSSVSRLPGDVPGKLTLSDRSALAPGGREWQACKVEMGGTRAAQTERKRDTRELVAVANTRLQVTNF